MGKFIRIFKAGTHVDSAGREHTYTVDDLDRMVELYNEQPDDVRRQAPLVYGHPKDNAPAHGWVGKLKREGEYLLASCEEMTKEFVESVTTGRYKFRSASFYPSGLLRHVGFLGAVQPAVAGLGDVAFSDADDAIIFNDFMDWDSAFRFVGMGSVFQRLRDWFIQTNGIEAADQIIPQYEIDSLKNAEPTPVDAPEYTEHSQHNHKDHDMELKEQLETLTRDFSEVKTERDALKSKADAQAQQITSLQQSVEELKATNTRREMENYCDGLITAGKMLASEREFFVEDLVAKASAQNVNFSEGVTALQATKTMLEARPAHTLFQEHATSDKAAPAPSTPSTGNSRIEFSQQDSDIDAKVRAKMAEKNISYTEAFDLISTEL